MNDYLELEREFEMVKREVKIDDNSKITIRIPVSFLEVFRAVNDCTDITEYIDSTTPFVPYVSFATRAVITEGLNPKRTAPFITANSGSSGIITFISGNVNDCTDITEYIDSTTYRRQVSVVRDRLKMEAGIIHEMFRPIVNDIIVNFYFSLNHFKFSFQF
jgi:hypothetical protein